MRGENEIRRIPYQNNEEIRREWYSRISIRSGLLQKICLKLYQKIWEKMSEKERKKAKERARDVDDEELKRELLISGILKKRRIPDVFSLYVN